MGQLEARPRQQDAPQPVAEKPRRNSLRVTGRSHQAQTSFRVKTRSGSGQPSSGSKIDNATEIRHTPMELDSLAAKLSGLVPKYSRCLDELEKLIHCPSTKATKVLIRESLSELRLYDRMVSGESDELLPRLQKYEAWNQVQERRQEVEAQLFSMPLCLTATLQGPDDVVVKCTNLAGNELAELHVRAHGDTFLDLRKQIRQCVPLPQGAPSHAKWKLVYQNEILAKSKDSVAVAEAFGL